MKSLILEEGKLKLKELDIPKVGEGEILVKMRSCGICAVSYTHLTLPTNREV